MTGVAKGKGKRPSNAIQSDAEKRAKKAAQQQARRNNMTEEQRHAANALRRNTMSKEKRDAANAQKQARRDNMSQEKRDAANAQKQARRDNMSQEKRDAVNAQQQTLRDNMSQEQKHAANAQKQVRRDNMSQEKRDVVNAQQQTLRDNMSQEQKHAANAQKQSRRDNMSQEKRDAVNAQQQARRDNMSQEKRDAVNAQQQAWRDNMSQEKKDAIRVKRAAYMRHYRATKKAKAKAVDRLYNEAMDRVRSQQSPTLSITEFNEQRAIRRALRSAAEGQVRARTSHNGCVECDDDETHVQQLQENRSHLLQHTEDIPGMDNLQMDCHADAGPNVPIMPPGVELSPEPQPYPSSQRPIAFIRLEELEETRLCYNKLPGMTERCSKCKAYLWPSEKKREPCCGKGKIELPESDWPYPNEDDPSWLADLDALINLYRHKNFMDNSRQYNAPFAFTSIGAKEEHFPTNGPPVYKIQGQMYHRMGSLLPPNGRPQSFAQVYLMESGDQLNRRCNMSAARDSDHAVLRTIQDILIRRNHYASNFYQFKDEIHRDSRDAFIRIEARQGQDNRTHNAPTVAEISVVMQMDGNNNGRDVVIFPKTGGFRNINETSSLYDPLQYPLLFPTGANGWNPYGFTYSNGKRMSTLDYYKYRLYRRKEFSPLHLAGKLGLQFWTDQHCKVETNRLRWYTLNQKQFRSDLYQDVNDVLAGDGDLNRAGKRIILPASYTGSNRYMAKSYQDAMAIVRALGSPALFATFTCNPNWDEIKDALAKLKEDAQLSHNIPAHYQQDIINRVFKLKLQQFEEDIINKSVFGGVSALVRVVEFQKRGLPHAHLLIILNNGLLNNRDIDGFISAELPDSDKHPRLHKLLKDHMMHKCDRRCLEDGVCKKRFPKSFIDETTTDVNGYPLYRRRTTNPDNSRIVPYNPYLLLKYNAHINIEACTSVSSVKYLYKYVYKGPDKADVEVHMDDEITMHQSMKYVSATEAVWHLLDYPTQYRTHSVNVLPVHLPGQQSVIWAAEDQPQNIQDRAEATKLLEFFKTCSDPHDRHSKDLRYIDMPLHYVWNVSMRKWTKRTRNTRSIGRLVTVSPKDEERFALRILLCHAKGPTSFDALKTVVKHGQVHQCQTFKEACELNGYLESDDEWDHCLAEAATFRMPNQLRQLFVTILNHCNPAKPAELYANHFKALSEDFVMRYRNRNDNDRQILVEGSTMTSIQEYLQSMGSHLANFQLPTIPQRFYELNAADETISHPNTLIREETSYNENDMRQTVARGRAVATEEHVRFLDDVLRHVDSKAHKMYFLGGEGGSGKSFISQIVLAETRLRGKIALGVASSGLAAQLLSGGRTAHSRFKIPVSTDENITCNYSLTRDTHFCELMNDTSLIIWDEISMVDSKLIEAVDRMLRDITEINQPFGGKVVIFSGDFKQVLPVIHNGTEHDIVRSTLPLSYLWSDITKFHLSQNMRLLRNDLSDEDKIKMKQFATFLLQVGNGETETIASLRDYVRLPADIAMHYDNDDSLKAFLNTIYGGISCVVPERMPAYLSERAILTPTNRVTDRLNETVLSMLPGESRQFLSADSVVDENNDSVPEETALTFPTEFLNTLNFNGFPPHKLELKVGAAIILLRNLCPSKGLCNGTRLIVKSLGDKVIEAVILSGQFVGQTFLIPRITFIDNNAQKPMPFQLKRHQFPIRLAYVMTINKAQGQTLKHVAVFLPEPVFSHGQLYVALSRATSRSNVTVLVTNGRKFQGDENVYVKNIVYRQVLQALRI